MKTNLKLTILGCGSSGGVPRLGNKWGACDPLNPKNTRLRCSLLIQLIGAKGTTTALIDTGPDMRQQLLRADIGHLDGVIFTHDHADHTHGLDDLRMIFLNRGAPLDVWANRETADSLRARFDYVFATPKGSSYPPILTMHVCEYGRDFVIRGAGGDIVVRVAEVQHGRMMVLAVRIGGMLYAPDISGIPDGSRWAFEGLDYLIIDALRYAPHPSHAHLEQTLQWIAEFAPRRAVLTNMHSDMDYEILRGEVPDGVVPAFDFMSLLVSN